MGFLPLHCATFHPNRLGGSVALPLPEWGFAVGGPLAEADQSLSSREDCRWPKKPHPSPPSAAWYFPPTQVDTARTVVSPWIRVPANRP
ncbi:hypothetical protein EMIT0357P_30057 [Pseudomonas marginalis]